MKVLVSGFLLATTLLLSSQVVTATTVFPATLTGARICRRPLVAHRDGPARVGTLDPVVRSWLQRFVGRTSGREVAGAWGAVGPSRPSWCACPVREGEVQWARMPWFLRYLPMR